MLVLACCSMMLLSIMPDAEPILKGLMRGEAVETMNRTALETELAERAAPYAASDSDDLLRMRLHHARGKLLEYRHQHVAHAERILGELNEHSGPSLLSDLSLGFWVNLESSDFTILSM